MVNGSERPAHGKPGSQMSRQKAEARRKKCGCGSSWTSVIARGKMKVGKDQPSIIDKFGKSKQLEGSRLDTTPAVPAPNSSRAEPEVSVAQLSPQQVIIKCQAVVVAQPRKEQNSQQEIDVQASPEMPNTQ